MQPRDHSSLLRRLNDHCARALEAAASLCQTRAHAEITIDHWLLKFLELGDGDIPALLRRYEIDLDVIWQSLLTTMDKLPHDMRGKPQLAGSLTELLEAAWMNASLETERPASTIRSAHLYMALLQTPHRLRSQDAWPLFSLTPVQVQRLLPWLEEISVESTVAARAPQTNNHDVALPATPVQTNTATPQNGLPLDNKLAEALSRFTIDLTEKARAGQIDPVFGREREIHQMIDILSRRRKNNPILVGDPGVGKTALVEGLALRIAEGDVPAALRNVHVRVLDMGLLQAGAGVKGEFEQRLKNVIDAVQQSPEPILLFIDEAHTLVGAGNSAGGADAANLLKPALARGELRTIAATTWSEYKQYFERDAALERRFQMVKVDEPDDDTACLMLRGLQERYAKHHNVHIRDEAIDAAVKLSRRYLTGRQLPDKAVDLIDTAAARVRMSLEARPQEIDLLQARLSALKTEAQALTLDDALGQTTVRERQTQITQELTELTQTLNTLQQRYEPELALVQQIRTLHEQLLTCLRSELPHTPQQAALSEELHGRLEALKKIQGNDPLIYPDVDAHIIAGIIADWTGVPVGNLLQDELSNLLKLETLISQRVIGQTDAIGAIAQSLRAAKAGLKTGDAPLGVFLLSGPSGVGKTETALALADALFGGERSLITINLSEYQEAHTVSQLKGSPPGYVGYGQGGVLTEAVRQRPYSIVLLDEVEKAHRDVLNLFYQVFDRGFMRDGEGREIDFRNTVILMTANLGSDALMELLAHPVPAEEPPSEEGETHNASTAAEVPVTFTQAELLDAVRPILIQHFQPALFARFQTILYRPLDNDALAGIVRLKLNKVAQRLQQQHRTQLLYDEALVTLLSQACNTPEAGARSIDHLLNQQILPAISTGFLQWKLSQQKTPTRARLGFSEQDGMTVDFEA